MGGTVQRRCARAGARGAAVATDCGSRWIVLLEAAPSDEASLIDVGTARDILRAMGDEHAVALQAPDRIAIQVEVRAAGMALALSAALARWRLALLKFVPKGWNLVRAEVLTPEELEREYEQG